MGQLKAIFQLYRGSRFIGGGNQLKTTELIEVSDKPYHMLYQVCLAMSGIIIHKVSDDIH